MFCTNCGQQMPDGSAFCTYCGATLAPAGGQQVWSGQTGQPAQPATPQYQSQPGAYAQPAQGQGAPYGQGAAQPEQTFYGQQQADYYGQQAQGMPYGGASSQGAYGAQGQAPYGQAPYGQQAAQPKPNPFATATSRFPLPQNLGLSEQEFIVDKRTLVVVLASALLLVLMFQSWVGLPLIDELITTLVSSTGLDDYAAYGLDGEALLTTFLTSSFSVPEAFGLAGRFAELSDFCSYMATQYSSYSSYSDTYVQMATQFKSAASSLAVAAWVLRVFVVLWAVSVVGVVAGLVYKLGKGSDSVLFYALVLTTLVALVCVVGLLVMNVFASANMSETLGELLDSTAVALSSSYVGPTVWSVASLVVAGGAAVYLYRA